MAARGARAATRADAPHRRSHAIRRERHGRTRSPDGFRTGPTAIGLDRRAERPHRLSLGRRQGRDHAQIRSRIGRARAGRHPLRFQRSQAPLLQATHTIPIVFGVVADPVGAGYVESLARPGGNATGFTPFEYSQAGKWLELLKEIAPRTTRAVVLRDSMIAAGPGFFGAIQAMAYQRPATAHDRRGVLSGGRHADRKGREHRLDPHRGSRRNGGQHDLQQLDGQHLQRGREIGGRGDAPLQHVA